MGRAHPAVPWRAQEEDTGPRREFTSVLERAGWDMQAYSYQLVSRVLRPEVLLHAVGQLSSPSASGAPSAGSSAGGPRSPTHTRPGSARDSLPAASLSFWRRGESRRHTWGAHEPLDKS